MIETAKPESVGVSSDSIIKFIHTLKQYDIPMHSILIARHGKLITEGYFKPFNPHMLHRMFSISKSFTSIAIGLLERDGRLNLDHSILRYFPEYKQSKPHPWLREMTIRDMLMMQTCHSSTTYKLDTSRNWVESFFTSKPSHQPGSCFYYDTSSSHTLCALVEKLTKMSLLDYLRSAFLNTIDFSTKAYMLKDPFGNSMGGSGLMATSRDLLLVAQLIINNGIFHGDPLIPSQYLKDALHNHSYTAIQGSFPETRHGYGYQFWRIRDGGFSCFGMGGQLMVFLPEEDLILITTADTQGMQGGTQLIYNALFEDIVPHLSSKIIKANPLKNSQLEEILSQLRLDPVQSTYKTPEVYVMSPHQYRISKNKHNFKQMTLIFDKDNKMGQLTFFVGDIQYRLPFGIGQGLMSDFPIYKEKCTSSGGWISAQNFHIKSHLIGEILGAVHFYLTFTKGSLSLTMKSTIEDALEQFSGDLFGIETNLDLI